MIEKLLIQYSYYRFLRYFSTKRLAKIITAVLFVFLLLALMIGIFLFFRRGFLVVAQDLFLKEALPFYIYEVFLLVVTYLIVASALVSGIFSLFKSRFDFWVVTSPNFYSLPSIAFWRVFLSSLWPLIVIAIPAIFAIRSVFGLGSYGFFIVFLELFSLALSLVLFALFIVLLVAKFLSLIRRDGLSLLTPPFLALGIVLVLFWLAYLGWQSVGASDIVYLFRAYDLELISAEIGPIFEQFRFFPSHFVASTLYLLGANDYLGAWYELTKVLLVLVISGSLLWLVSSWHVGLWQIFQEGRLEARTTLSKYFGGRVRFPRYARSATGVIFEKEALVFFRNVKNVLWLGFLFFLWLIQTGLNVILGRNIAQYEFGPGIFSANIEVLQILTIVFFVSAFVLRFSFPAFSTERRTSWILGSVPLDFTRLFWAKLLFYTLIFTFLGFVAGLLNIYILDMPFHARLFSILSFIVACVFINVLGLSLGALFPDFETDDPEVLSTSLPGIAFIFLSLLYGGWGALSLHKFLSAGVILPLILFVISSLALTAALLYIAPRSLKKIEFVKVIS